MKQLHRNFKQLKIKEKKKGEREWIRAIWPWWQKYVLSSGTGVITLDLHCFIRTLEGKGGVFKLCFNQFISIHAIN